MKTLVTHLGSTIQIFSLFLLLPIFVAWIYQESVLPFAWAMVLAIVVGLLLKLGSSLIGVFSGREADITNISMAQALALSALSYICLSLLAMVPFLFVFRGFSPLLNSFFESVSGLTTTGLTTVTDVTKLPNSMLFWRSELQWIGGIGIVVIVLFLIHKLRTREKDLASSSIAARSSLTIYKAVLPERLETGIKSTIKRVLSIYAVYTAVEIFLLIFAGLSFFEAINITFTSLSTGGFIVTKEFYSNGLQLLIIGIFMVLGATSFIVHDQFFKLRIKQALRNIELRLLLILVAVASVLSLFVFRNLKVILFELLSAFTGTGYSVTHIGLLPQLMIFLITIGMLTGASLGSTCGGMKLLRVYSLFKAVIWKIRTLSYPPNAVIPFKVRKKAIPESMLLAAEIFVSAYIILIIFGIIIFMVLGYSFLDSSFQVISAMGTVGLSTISIYHIPVLGKLVLITLMLLGRLEIFPFLVLVYKVFSKG